MEDSRINIKAGDWIQSAAASAGFLGRAEWLFPGSGMRPWDVNTYTTNLLSSMYFYGFFICFIYVLLCYILLCFFKCFFKFIFLFFFCLFIIFIFSFLLCFFYFS